MSNIYTTCILEHSGNNILAFKSPILVEETNRHVIKVYYQYHCLNTSVLPLSLCNILYSGDILLILCSDIRTIQRMLSSV